jgi:putative transcriptional regulator
METLGNRLRTLRFEHSETTQQQLADAVGVARQTINSIEKGKFNPSVLLALRIARFFGRPTDSVFFIREEGEP